MAGGTDDYSDNTQTTGVVAIGAITWGTFETRGDADWFKVRLNAGVTYEFTLYGASTGHGTLPAPRDGYSLSAIYLFDPDGSRALHFGSGGYDGQMPSLPLTPAVSGDYFVAVQSFEEGAVYAVGAAAITGDDHGDTMARASQATVGRSATGAIGAANDSDWFKVRLEEGKLYAVTLTGAAVSTGLTGLELYDAGGDRVSLPGAQSSAAGFAYGLNGVPYASGDYYLEVYSPKAAGDYQFTVTEASDDYLASTATRGTLKVGGTASGTIDLANDRDWFRLSLDADTRYSISLGNNEKNQELTVIYPDGTQGSFGGKAGFTTDSAGDYYVEVSGPTGAYTLTAAKVTDDHADNGATGSIIAVGATVSASFDFSGDVDAFRVPVEAGHLYNVTVSRDGGDGYFTSAWANNDGGVAIVADTQYSNQNKVFSFKALATGMAAVGATSYDMPAGYGLTVTDIGKDDHGDDPEHFSWLAPGATVAGVIETASDDDVFRMHMEAGVSYTVTVGGELATNSWGGMLKLGTGKDASYPDASAVGMVNVTPSATGDYYLYASSRYKTGAYTLTMNLLADDYTANAATTGKLTVNGTASGKIDATNDRDWFAVNLEAGKLYWFDRVSSDSVYPSLALYDAAGNKLASPTSDAIPTVSYTPATSGVYYVQAAHDSALWYMSNGIYTGSYTISARLGTADDFPAPTPLATGVQITGSLELKGDDDTFLLDLTAGHFYRVEFETRDSSGAFVPGSNTFDIRGVNNDMFTSRLSDRPTYKVYQPQASGTYKLPIALYSDQGPDYRLRVLDLGLDANAAPGADTALTLGSARTGALEVADDTDTYTLALQQGQRVAVTLTGKADGGGTLALSDMQSSLSVTQSTGWGMDASAWSGPSNRIVFTAKESGVYNVKIGASYNGVSGTYTLRADDVTTDTTGPQLLRAGEVGLDGTLHITFNEAIQRTDYYYQSETMTITRSNAQSLAYISSSDSYGQLSFSGAELTVKARNVVMPGDTYTVEIPARFLGDLAGNPLDRALSFTVQAAQGATAPGSGNDVYAGHANGARIDGGAGFDTAVYSGYASDFLAKRSGDGYSLATAADNAKADLLSGIERVRFTQGMDAMAFDTTGVAGKAYRLYQSAFDRTPDKSGVGYWINAMDHGATLLDVAHSFVASDEFKTLYGAQATDAEFIARLYQNVLHRAGEPAGVAYWNGVLKQGADRAEVLAAFSEGAENTAGVAKVIGDGFVYTPWG